MIAFAEQYITLKALGEFPKISRSFLQHMPYISASTTVTHTAMDLFQHGKGYVKIIVMS
jgi:hypothetical protein